MRKQVWRQNEEEDKRRFNGELGLTQYTRERQREREREKHKKLCSKNTLTQKYIHVCVQWTPFIQVFRRTDRSTIVLQCSLKSSTLTPKIYSLRNILHNGLPVLCTEPAFLRTGLRTSLRTRPNRSVPTDPVLGFFRRSGRCWACLSTYTFLGNCLNLCFELTIVIFFKLTTFHICRPSIFKHLSKNYSILERIILILVNSEKISKFYMLLLYQVSKIS